MKVKRCHLLQLNGMTAINKDSLMKTWMRTQLNCVSLTNVVVCSLCARKLTTDLFSLTQA